MCVQCRKRATLHCKLQVGRRYVTKQHLSFCAVARRIINSVATFWHGVKVDRPPEVTVLIASRARMRNMWNGYMFQAVTAAVALIKLLPGGGADVAF